MNKEYNIFIQDPKTTEDKNITGTVKIKPATEGDKTGYVGIGSIGGFPDGSIIEYRTDLYSTDNFDDIRNSIISALVEKIKVKYKITLVLGYIESIKEEVKTETSAEQKKEDIQNPTDENEIDIKKINSDLVITVLEGPGPIIGNTKLTIKDGFVYFDDIEFSEAGDYLVQIKSPNNAEIEPINFGLTILTKEVDLQEKTEETVVGKEVKEEIKLERSKITQILDPKIKLDPIGLPLTNNKSDDKSIVSNIGNTPLLQLNIKKASVKNKETKTFDKYVIDQRNILEMSLSHRTTTNDPYGILPHAEVTYKITDKKQKNTTFPLIGSTFEIFIKSNTQDLKSIHLRFNIENSYPEDDKITLSGKLSIEDIFVNKSLTTMELLGVEKATSFEVLKKISNDLKLGFNSNIIDTKDPMDWRLENNNLLAFINSITKRSYIDDNSFQSCYVDYYYCLNFVDLNKEMNRDVEKDANVETSVFSKSKEDSKITLLTLTNDKGSNMSNQYVEDIEFMDNSTQSYLKKGSISISQTYDSKTKTFLEFKHVGNTSDGEKTLISKPDNWENQYKIESLSRLNTDNVHPNYNFTLIQNKRNLLELNNFTLKGELPNPNYSIYLHQKVKFIFIDQIGTPTETNIINSRCTGTYIIKSLNYYWDGLKLRQEITLKTKEIGKTPQEINANNFVEKTKNDTKEDSKNPEYYEYLDYKPNQEYVVGNIYTIENDGVRFLLTVSSLSEDGNHIVGKIKQIIPSTIETQNIPEE